MIWFIIIGFFFFFEIIISYHVYLYYLTVFYLISQLFKQSGLYNLTYLFLIILFFWGISISFHFSIQPLYYYFYIINRCLEPRTSLLDIFYML